VFDDGAYVATALAEQDARLLFVPRPALLDLDLAGTREERSPSASAQCANWCRARYPSFGRPASLSSAVGACG
jgi:hypothetical protein